LNEGIHLLERSAVRIGKALHLLRPTDEYAEPCRLDKFGKFADLWRAKAISAKTGGGEVLDCLRRRDIVDTSDELLVANQILFHTHMLAACRAVGKLCARLLEHATSSTGHNGAVDNGQLRFVLTNVS